MVIRGATRGNGRQLAGYLLREAGNDRIELLDVAGRDRGSEQDLHDALYDMSVTAELSRSEKGLYHAQINPAPGEDSTMSKEHWFEAADILGGQLGLQEQRRVIVLHEKKGRTHAHVVWERYDHEKGVLVSDSFSRLAQDRARGEMERAFGHKQTPKRNAHRPELKQALTDTWAKTQNGSEFVKEAKAQGYVIAEGVPRHPYMVVDENGRSFDLVRQLQGIRIKEVRARMKGESLIGEKEAIEQIRAAKAEGDTGSAGGREQAKAAFKAKLHQATGAFSRNKEDITQPVSQLINKEANKEQLAKDFARNKANMLRPDKETEAMKRKREATQQFAENRDKMLQPDAETEAHKRNQEKAQAFASNKSGITEPQKAKEQLRQQFLEQKRAIEERRQQQRDKGREPD